MGNSQRSLVAGCNEKLCFPTDLQRRTLDEYQHTSLHASFTSKLRWAQRGLNDFALVVSSILYVDAYARLGLAISVATSPSNMDMPPFLRFQTELVLPRQAPVFRNTSCFKSSIHVWPSLRGTTMRYMSGHRSVALRCDPYPQCPHCFS